MNRLLLMTLFLCGLVVLSGWLSGCGKGAESYATPTDVAKDFDAAMRAGDLDKAARLFDYEQYARSQNEDWDQIPTSQRQLVINKLIDEKKGQLQQLKAAYGTANYTVGAEQVSGNTATVALQGATGSLTVTCIQTGKGWKIQSIQ